MARNPARGDLTRRIARMEEEIRQLRARRQPVDLAYTLVDSDFNNQTISGTLYGWRQNSFATKLRLIRYGPLLLLTGAFERLWTTDGSTPAGWSGGTPEQNICGPSSLGYSWLSASAIPDELWPVVGTDNYSIPIYYRTDTTQEDLKDVVFTGGLPLSYGFDIALEHLDLLDSYTQLAELPQRRTVRLFVNCVVPIYH